MAKYLGGTIDENEKLVEVGLWEKEDYQGLPKVDRREIYSKAPHRAYLPTENPYLNLYRHGVHSIATELGATYVYLWLMPHTSDALGDILGQLAIDEIKHMTKFWGFGVWVYADTSAIKITKKLIKTRHQNYTRNSLRKILKTMMQTLKWDFWSFSNKSSLLFTFTSAIHQLWIWNNTLTLAYLNELIEEMGIQNSKLLISNA